MDTQEQIDFIKKIHPFENLTKQELTTFAENLDIIYLNKDEIIQEQNEEPQKLYFIIKGLVQEKQENEVLSIYSKNEIFDPISLIENYSKHTFVTTQETICYTLPKELFLKVLRQNTQMESFFFQSISQKLNSNINNEKNKDMANIMVAKVKDAKIHRAVILPYETTIYDAVLKIKQEKVPTLLLKDDEGNISIVTDSDFREKVILNRMSFDDTVGKLSNGNLIYIKEEDFLFNAQLMMAKHGIKRVIVKNAKEEIVGILDQISLSSYFATNTFAVSNEIVKAQNIEELKAASHSVIKIIKSLNTKGVKIEFISKLINQLNRKLLNKLFKMIAPQELLDKSCLVVMGSEGRAEQILRTDQDNALILQDDCEISDEELQAFTNKFTETLVDFGFPRCDGNIMVSNPYWCRRVKDFKDLVYSWVKEPSPDNLMNTAIFYDSYCVYGNKDLILELKEYLFKASGDNKIFFANFAKVVTNFDVPLGFFDGFVFNSNDKEHKNELDIKKGGLFILIQSIRSLSLEYKLLDTNTNKRIKALTKVNAIDEEFAKELIEVFKFLSNLKLKSNIEKLDKKQEVDNYINPDNLNTMQKDLLKDSFKIINKLKKKLETHYKLNYV